MTRGTWTDLRRWAAILLALGAVASSVPAHAADGEVRSRGEVSTYLTALRAELDLPGVAVAVLDGDDVVLEEVLGEDGDGRPVTRETPQLIGSVAKSMTATLVVQQAEDGRLDLDERVGGRLPWLHDTEATVRQLLTHTSGYTASDGLAVSERFDDQPGAVRRAAADLRSTGTRGSYAYSSANYLVLGALLEALEDRPYAEILRRDLLGPLGMGDTSGAAEAGRDLPAGHQWWFGRPRAHQVGMDESGAPYGYVVSSLADLETYAAAQAGARPDVLGGELLASVHAPRVRADDDRYGYGWRVTGDGAGRLVHHTGATPGFFAHVLVRPSDGRSVVVLAGAYGEAQAPALAGVAKDVLMITDGGSAAPTSGDPVLGALPWVLGAAAAIGALLVALVRARTSVRRWGRAVAAGVVAGSLLLLPGLLGTDLRQLRIWAPDSFLALVVAATAWALLAGALVVSRRGPAAGVRGS
jgi:CubicO group peptidase (beta-lactamase class C family)